MPTKLPDLTCTKCKAEIDFVRANGLTMNPPGWAYVMLQGRPMTNGMLCASCAAIVRKAITDPPADGGDFPCCAPVEPATHPADCTCLACTYGSPAGIAP